MKFFTNAKNAIASKMIQTKVNKFIDGLDNANTEKIPDIVSDIYGVYIKGAVDFGIKGLINNKDQINTIINDNSGDLIKLSEIFNRMANNGTLDVLKTIHSNIKQQVEEADVYIDEEVNGIILKNNEVIQKAGEAVGILEPKTGFTKSEIKVPRTGKVKTTSEFYQDLGINKLFADTL